MKRGISAIVSVVLMVLIITASVSIIWVAIIPMITSNLELSALSNPLSIVTSGGHTFYDATTKLASVHVKRGPGDEDISKVKVVFSVDGESAFGFVDDAPDPLESRVYVFNLTDQGEPQSVEIAPFFLIGDNEKEGEMFMDIELSEGIVENVDTVTIYEIVDDGYVEEEEEAEEEEEEVSPFLRTISYDGVSVDLLIDKPDGEDLDVLLLYHGTAVYDSEIFNSAERILLATKDIIVRDDLMYVSVVYPEEGLLFGDNIAEAEAALLWVKNAASAELGINVGNVYMLGHSQGGYLVVRLNTMHETDGVVANGAGPINLTLTCRAEETSPTGVAMIEQVCGVLKDEYGSVFDDPDAYSDRSMVNFPSGYKSRILFVQGMEDAAMQLFLWNKFKPEIFWCASTMCWIWEVAGVGHEAVFYDSGAAAKANTFLFG